MTELAITILCAIIALAAINLFFRTHNWRRWTYLSNALGFAVLAWASSLDPPWSVLGVGIIVAGEGLGTLARWFDFEFSSSSRSLP